MYQTIYATQYSLQKKTISSLIKKGYLNRVNKLIVLIPAGANLNGNLQNDTEHPCKHDTGSIATLEGNLIIDCLPYLIIDPPLYLLTDPPALLVSCWVT